MPICQLTIVPLPSTYTAISPSAYCPSSNLVICYLPIANLVICHLPIANLVICHLPSAYCLLPNSCLLHICDFSYEFSGLSLLANQAGIKILSTDLISRDLPIYFEITILIRHNHLIINYNNTLYSFAFSSTHGTTFRANDVAGVYYRRG